MLVHIFGAKCIGIDAVKVTVEVDITMGIGIHLCGLGDIAVKESLLRTITALQSLNYHIPGKKIVINLAPADLHKSGSGYDLPIAIGIIAASQQRTLPLLGETLVMGELGLDGSVRPIKGGLPIADFAAKNGFKKCILPYSSALEASEMDGIDVYGIRSLEDAFGILEGKEEFDSLKVNTADFDFSREVQPISYEVDFSDIIGQEGAKRAMEIAASGGHNIIMIGAPGSGKSSMAKALAGILPPMSKEESFTCSKIYSIAGLGDLSKGLMKNRPYRSPHYSASMAAIIGGGGGSDNIIPGEVTLAHQGVLFLDEFNMMPKSVLESLRAPLEDRKVIISLYFSRLSGPIMDRMDLQVWIHSLPPEVLRKKTKGESSAQIRKRVLKARERQEQRFQGSGIHCNSEMTNKQIERFCALDSECEELMNDLMSSMSLSMRAYYRIIKVARTIADIEGSEKIKSPHLMEAAGYRFLDKITIN